MSIVLSPATLVDAAKIMNKITNLLQPPYRENYHTSAASLFSPHMPTITFEKNGKFFTVKSDEQIVFAAVAEIGFLPVVSVYFRGDWEIRLMNA